MKNISVAILDDTHTLTKQLGKGGTETDIVMSHTRFGDIRYTFLGPLHYPDKMRALTKCINMADVIVLCVNQLDKTLGELILTCHLSNKPGLIYSKDYNYEVLKDFIKSTRLDGWTIINSENEILNKAGGLYNENSINDSLEIVMDQAFNVKGIGPVVLGTLINGKVKPHDKIKMLPSNTEVEIRSIQVHDDNVDQAVKGERVGLALKKIDVEKIKSDKIIVNPDNDHWLISDEINLKLNKLDLIKTELEKTFAISYYLVEATVIEYNNGKVKLDKNVAYKKGINGFVYSNDSNVPRIRGTFKI